MSDKSGRDFQDPAAQAANLILRLGIAILGVGVPCCAVVSRRLLFVLMPVGAVLIIIGGLLTPVGRDRINQIRGLLSSPVVLMTLFLIFWAGLSLMWTPSANLAVERYLKTAGTVMVAIIAILALPGHVKASNSNLLPIGVTAAALAIVCVGLLRPGELRAIDDDGSTLQRATIGAVVLVWPALGALALRQRFAVAGVVAVAVAITAVVVWMPNAVASLIAAMLVFSIAYSNPLLSGRILGLFAAALIMLAPILPLITPTSLLALADSQSASATVAAWAQIAKTEGLRHITGHGFDTSLRALSVGFLPAQTPRGILFEVWYELGVLGAAGLSGLILFAFRAAGRAEAAIAPFLLAALTGVFVIAISGLSVAQLWWVTLLAIVAISFAIVVRGDNRDKRVHASVLKGQRPKL